MRVLLILLVALNELCLSSDYCTVCSRNRHVMCRYEKGPSKSCQNYKGSDINSEVVTSIVSLHNKLRNKVAKGLETKGNPGPQPAASNMQVLILHQHWDTELAEIAQVIADRCFSPKEKFVDDCRLTKRFPYGVLIASMIYDKLVPLDFSYIINYWYNQVKLFNATKIDNFTLSANTSTDLYRYYTQLVWADTRFVGCGHSSFQEFTSFGGNERKKSLHFIHRLVCNYGPTGNNIGARVYRRGIACTDCPTDYGCSEEYPGLCDMNLTTPVIDESFIIDGVNIDENETVKAAVPEVRFIVKNVTTPVNHLTNESIIENKKTSLRHHNEGDPCYCGFVKRIRSSHGTSIFGQATPPFTVMPFFLQKLLIDFV